ncbi:MAG: hypothetical protein R6V85_19975 [Polyangia bacterium]
MATFGGGYVFSALVGFLLYTEATVPENQTCLNCQTAGKRMFIPVAGPFMAIPVADGLDGRIVSGVMGTVQVVGLLLTAAGAIVYGVSGNPEHAREQSADRPMLARLRLGAAPTPDGGGALFCGCSF